MALPLADKITPKNNGTFPLVDAKDVLMPDGSRLSDMVIRPITQADYDALVEADTVDEKTLYLIVESDTA